jgi:hypothetical protein
VNSDLGLPSDRGTSFLGPSLSAAVIVEEGSLTEIFSAPRTERLRALPRRFSYNEAVVGQAKPGG